MRKKTDLQFDDFAPDLFSSGDLDYVEVPISRYAFWLIIITSVVAGFIVTSRFLFLSGFKGDAYAMRAISNVNRETTIPAQRGVITDRYGVVLAQNADTFSVFIGAADLLKDRAQLTITVRELSDVLGISLDELWEIIESTDFERNSEIALVRNITPEQAIAVRGLALPFVYVEQDVRREYPSGPAFSSVVGYTGLSTETNEIIGKDGLEAFYDAVIRGKDGLYVYYRDVFGKVFDEQTILDPVPGSKVVTTIDAEFQQYFYDRLRSGMRTLGVRGGVGLAIDPRNGEVLAMISLPGFDNNIFTTPERNRELTAIFTDTGQPLFNRVVSGLYSPGSTIKPLVALGALHENFITPEKSILSIGYIEIPNPFYPDKPSRFVDWKAHGWVDMWKALAVSSNVYFYEVGGGFEDVKGLGISGLRKYWDFFGFGKDTGIDLPGERIGFLPAPDEKEERTGQPWRIGDTYNVSIGQGDFLVTPIQLINYIASIAADGKMYQPSLVRKIFPFGSETPIEPGNLKDPILDYSDWSYELEQVQIGMRDAVSKSYGTARLLNDLPLPSAGKTGSAQTNNNQKTNAFFVGYGPYEDPEIAIVVLVENAKEGSLNAVPIARDVMDWYYQHRVLSRKDE